MFYNFHHLNNPKNQMKFKNICFFFFFKKQFDCFSNLIKTSIYLNLKNL